MGTDILKQSQQVDGIDQVTRDALRSMEISIKPSKEQIEKDVSSIRKQVIKDAGTDQELIDFIENAEIVYSGFYNGELLYGVIRDRDGTISAFYNGNGKKRISIGYSRDPYPNQKDKVAEGFRKLYQDEIKQLGYKEKTIGGQIKTYKVDKDGEREINIKSPEYFDLHCNLEELSTIRSIKRIKDIKKEGESLSIKVLEKGLFFRVLTFDDIDFFKSNGNISEEQYNQAKEQIAKYYYRLVYLGVIKRAEAGTKTQEYFDKKYISQDTYNRTMKFLEEKK